MNDAAMRLPGRTGPPERADRERGADLERTLRAAALRARAGLPGDAARDLRAVETCGTPEDYSDREGYVSGFLGDDVSVPLPTVVRNAEDVLRFEWRRRSMTELKYEHFSVVMSRRRRMCLVSAANLDGRQSTRLKETGWRRDPRIPAEMQISEECYGPAPGLGRGYMTSRVGVTWGAAAATANGDAMHVTNTVPQVRPLTADLWLGVEDYAMEHARAHGMRLCVFTGPFLLINDPVRFGVRIPRLFWKVIAFVHDETDALCVTGYLLSQDELLREDDIVPGRQHTSQVPLTWIEQRAGLSFGSLASVDPLGGIEDAIVGPRLLTDFRQILFLTRH